MYEYIRVKGREAWLKDENIILTPEIKTKISEEVSRAGNSSKNGLFLKGKLGKI